MLIAKALICSILFIIFFENIEKMNKFATPK